MTTRIGVLDTRTGALLRTLAAGYGSPLLVEDPRTGRLVAPSAEGRRVAVVDPRTGTVVRVIRLGARVLTALAPDPLGDLVYLGGGGLCDPRGQRCRGWVQALDTRTGALGPLHVLDDPSRPDAGRLAVDGGAGHLVLARGPDAGTAIEVVDAATGRRVGGGVVSFMTVGPRPVAIDAAAGRAVVALYRSAIPFHGPPGTGPLPSLAALAIVDTRAGRLVRTIPLGPGRPALALDARGGRVDVATYGPVRYDRVPEPNGRVVQRTAGAGALYVLDARDGTMVRTVSTGLATTAVAVDGVRGRVYVASAGPVTLPWGLVGQGMVTVVDARTGAILRRVRVDPHADRSGPRHARAAAARGDRGHVRCAGDDDLARVCTCP